MATVNSLQNNVASRNVGLTTSFLDPRLIKGALIVPKGYTILAADLAALQTKLLADAAANSKAARIYPIANLVDFKDSSEKAIRQNFGYGPSKTVRDGAYTWQFQFTKGGHTLLSALRIFNGDAWDYLFVDSKNVLIGQIYVDPVTGAKGVQAIPSIDFYAEPFSLNDGKKVAEYLVNFSFFPEYVNELIGFISDAGFSILDTVKGLKDVNLAGVGSATPGTYTITLTDAMGVNLFGNIANLTGAANAQWVVTNDVTGLVIPVTSVNSNATANGGAGAFDVVLPTAHANYPAGATKIAFNLVGPTALVAANVGNYESTGAVKITKN
jgi:hypothetical protein